MRLILFLVAVMAVEAGAPVEVEDAQVSSLMGHLHARIDAEELLQPVDVDDLNCTQAWVLANTVLASNGYIFNDDLAVELFRFDMLYAPNPEVTYDTYTDYLSPADTWNLDLLMGVELARCEDGLRTLTVPPVLVMGPGGAMTVALASTSVDSGSVEEEAESAVEPERAKLAEILVEDDDDQDEVDDDDGAEGVDEEESVVNPVVSLEEEMPAELAPEPTPEPEVLVVEEEAQPELDLEPESLVEVEARPDLEPAPELEPEVTCELQEARIAELMEEVSALGAMIITLMEERDQLVIDNGLLEERNEHLVDANVALTQDEEIQRVSSASLIAGLQVELARLTEELEELGRLNANLVDANAALTLDAQLAAESVPILVPDQPVVTEEVIVEPEPEPGVTTYDTLLTSVALGNVADKELIVTLNCDQVNSLYWAIPARYGIPAEEAVELYTNTDRLNELRLARRAREQGCKLSTPAGS